MKQIETHLTLRLKKYRKKNFVLPPSGKIRNQENFSYKFLTEIIKLQLTFEKDTQISPFK